MKIITKEQQKEVFMHLAALRRICDNCNEANIKLDRLTEWAANMDYIADNLLAVANIIGGLDMMVAMLNDLESGYKEQMKENENDRQ